MDNGIVSLSRSAIQNPKSKSATKRFHNISGWSRMHSRNHRNPLILLESRWLCT